MIKIIQIQIVRNCMRQKSWQSSAIKIAQNATAAATIRKVWNILILKVSKPQKQIFILTKKWTILFLYFCLASTKIQRYFRSFLVQIKTLRFASEIYWPLASLTLNTYSVEFRMILTLFQDGMAYSALLKTGSDKIIYWLGRFSFLLGFITYVKRPKRFVILFPINRRKENLSSQ